MYTSFPRKYAKEEPKDAFSSTFSWKFAFRSRLLPISLPIIAVVLIITQVIIPLVSFKTQDHTTKPVEHSALGVATGFRDFSFEELGSGTTPSVLGVNNKIKVNENIPTFFYLTIPKLNIENALVETNAKTLSPDNALGHYKGSALPGEIGNAFVYGHSVLPFFYNPKNYKTIFSTLNRLEKGDEIFVRYNNKSFKYVVEGKRDLKPEIVKPLDTIKPAYLNESTMILMTCSPPGTKIRRLLIDTVLVNG